MHTQTLRKGVCFPAGMVYDHEKTIVYASGVSNTQTLRPIGVYKIGVIRPESTTVLWAPFQWVGGDKEQVVGNDVVEVIQDGHYAMTLISLGQRMRRSLVEAAGHYRKYDGTLEWMLLSRFGEPSATVLCRGPRQGYKMRLKELVKSHARVDIQTVFVPVVEFANVRHANGDFLESSIARRCLDGGLYVLEGNFVAMGYAYALHSFGGSGVEMTYNRGLILDLRDKFVTDFDVSPDGRFLAVATCSTLERYVDTTTVYHGLRLYALRAHDDVIDAVLLCTYDFPACFVSFSPDGQVLAMLCSQEPLGWYNTLITIDINL